MKKITQSLFLLFFLYLFATSTTSATEIVLPPTITCPGDIVVLNDPGECGAAVDYISMASANDPEEGDISGLIMTTLGPVSGGFFPVGLTMVELSVTDAEGNTVSCIFNVTVNDVEDPTISCPADVVTDNDLGVCGATVTFAVEAMDNCGGGTNAEELTTTFADNNGQSGIMFDITASGGEDVYINGFLGHMGVNFGGETIEIWYKVDSHVGFESNPTPWILHETVNATDNGNTGPGGNAVTPLSTPLLIPDGMTYGIFYYAGVINIDYTDGTTSYSDAFITVDSGSGKAPGSAHAFDGMTFTPRIVNSTIYYSTGSLGVTQTTGFPSGSVFPIGTTTNTFEITDASGNTASCSFDITVNDTEPPVASCPANITANTDPGSCDAVVNFTVPTSDNCAGETLNQLTGLPSGSVFPIGTTTNSFEVTDAVGNTAFCSFDVTVTDTEPPVATCPANITANTDPGRCDAVVSFTVPTSDNCAGETLNQLTGLPSGSVFPIGTTTNSFEVTDAAGLTSVCSFDITVIDTEAPVLNCLDITIQLDAAGMAFIDITDIDGGSTDNCGIASSSIDITTFDCSDIGVNDVVLTVTDIHGNVSTCTAIVTVEGEEFPPEPTAICRNVTATLSAEGTVTVLPEAVNNGSLGIECEGTLSLMPNTFTCDDVGSPILVTLTVANGNGVTDVCTAFVHVVDSLDPTIECPDTQTVITTGSYTLPDYVAQGDVLVADNCDSNLVITQMPAPGTVLEPGGYNITTTVVDPSDNVASCLFQLFIETPLGVEEQQDISSLLLYPNPASGYVMLANPQGLSLKDISIVDIGGRLIKKENLLDMGLEKRIDMSQLASATYMVIITSDEGTLVKQIVKE